MPAADGGELREVAARLRQIASEIDLILEEYPGLARVHRLRRSRAPDLEIEVERADCVWRGRRVPGLSGTHLRIVEYLSRRPGVMRTREELVEIVDPNMERAPDLRAVDVHIKRIRKCFRSVDPGFTQIEAVTGFGYRWRSDP